MMEPAGVAAVEISKANGNWDALDAIQRLEEPDDLRTALDDVPTARAHWDAFPRSAKRAILDWISTAKKDETRAKRVAETVSEAALGRRANQPRQPGGRSGPGADAAGWGPRGAGGDSSGGSGSARTHAIIRDAAVGREQQPRDPAR